MTSTRKIWIVAAVTTLEAGCLLGVASLGRDVLSDEHSPPEPEARPTEAYPAVLEPAKTEAQHTPDRAAIPEVACDERAPSGGNVTRSARKESEFYAAFLELAAREPDSFEQAARGALREDGPACRKVAALRVLCDTRSPGANDALAAAVLDLSDVSSGHSESVPGFALRRLSMRARQDAGARRVLDEIVFGQQRPPSRLRAAAADALCAAADEVELRRITERMRGESDELVLASVRSRLSVIDPPTAEIAEREE